MTVLTSSLIHSLPIIWTVQFQTSGGSLWRSQFKLIPVEKNVSNKITNVLLFNCKTVWESFVDLRDKVKMFELFRTLTSSRSYCLTFPGYYNRFQLRLTFLSPGSFVCIWYDLTSKCLQKNVAFFIHPI